MEQQQILLAIGKWLETNGEAIYGSRPSTRFGEAGGGFRFTVKGDALYVFGMAWTESEAAVASLGTESAKVADLRLLGGGKLEFSQKPEGFTVKLPANGRGSAPYVLKVAGVV